MKIRHSELTDLKEMLAIYEHARSFMAANGNPDQWGPTGWPPEELLRQDIDSAKSYVCINDDDEVLGTFCFDHGKDIEPTYRQITEGKWLDESEYGVVHRIAVRDNGAGVGQFCLEWAYDQCGHLRIDTHPDNKVMRHLLEKLGFVSCGTVFVVEDVYPRIAFEKSESLWPLYHVGYRTIEVPDVHYGRRNADFGPGFYTSADKAFSVRWARKHRDRLPVLNRYVLNVKGLNIIKLARDSEWFDCISSNRNGQPDRYEGVDVMVGPIANDTIYDTLGILTSGLVSAQLALQILSGGPAYYQTVIKSEKAVLRLAFLGSETISEETINACRLEVRSEEEAFQSQMAGIIAADQ